MSLTTRTIPALMNGISRQPAILRSPDQTEDELNTWGQLATGLSKRPPTTVVNKLEGLDLGDATVHHINRDISERYTVIIDQGGIQVFDETDGSEKVVNAPLGWGYLDAAGPDYRAVTVADYTFIVNTKKTVALKGLGADEVAQDPNLRWAGGTSPTRLTGFVGDWARIAQQAQYAANPPSTGGLVGTVKSQADLPDPPAGIYRVLGSTDTAFVSYYVRADGAVWDETVAPGLKNAFDENTMPHALIREADGTFTFAPFTWQPRRVGDLETNPYPPFLGRAIRDVFFYQNRLAFLVDESVVFSVAGDYGDFWRRTVLDYIDSDALAASATTTDVAILDYAVPFADGVMLFSKQKQLSLTNGDSGLSAHSLAIQPVTSYIMAPEVKPTPLGSQVHFVSSSSGYSAIQEYTRLAGADPTEAADITAHVPGLIPEGATQLIPAADLDALFVITRNASTPNRLYAYQFFWDGDKKLESAWRVWDFGDGNPVSGSYESGALHLVMERPDGFFLEKIDLRPEAVSENQEHLIYLDRAEALTGVYDAVSDTTTFTASHTLDPALVSVVRGVGSALPESEVSPSSLFVDGSTVTVPGDESAAPATVGHRYTMKVTLSQQYPVDWRGRALSTGRLQLHTFTVNLVDTAYTRAEVYPYGKAASDLHNGELKHTQEFTGKVIGATTAVLGQKSYWTGPFTFSVAGNSKETQIDLVNDSPFASTYVSAEWEGLFFQRAMNNG